MLFITSFIGTVATLISPDNPNVKKYVKFTCTIVMLAILILPLKNVLSNIPQISYTATEPAFNQTETSWAFNKTVEATQEYISELIYKKTGIKTENVYIYVSDDTKIAVYVYINEVDKDLVKEIEEYLDIILICDATVEITGE